MISITLKMCVGYGIFWLVILWAFKFHAQTHMLHKTFLNMFHLYVYMYIFTFPISMPIYQFCKNPFPFY